VCTLPSRAPAVFAGPGGNRNAVLRWPAMHGNDSTGLVAALRRKLRALAAIAEDPGATASEKAVATTLKKRLERRLRKADVPAGDWTDHAFRLGRWVRIIGRAASADAPNGDWTDHAHHLGKSVRRGYRKWPST
jgi:hypothetical protein